MNVLSLFDGMSCGQIALNRLNTDVTNYFASEIKPHAIKVSKFNFPKTIHIGNVKKIHYKNNVLFTENGNYPIGKIDLLIGGSPCQDLSSMNKNQVGLSGSKSSLFWEFVRIKEEVNPTYFLLENVGSSPLNDIVTITNTLKVNGVRINSSLVSAQMRDRIYWTNIPGTGYDLFGNNFIEQPDDRKIYLKDIIEDGFIDIPKAGCLLANNDYVRKEEKTLIEYVKRRIRNMSRSGMPIVFKNKSLCFDDGIRTFTQTELEKLQTIPQEYTSCLNYRQAANVIGDGWTIDVICHIFRGLISQNQVQNAA